MSRHGLCYDEGQSGRCGRECQAFQDGDCEIEDEIKEREPECVLCNYNSDINDDRCTHPQQCPGSDIEDFIDNQEGSPEWCPIKRQNETKQQENENMTDSKFDYNAKQAQVKGNALNAMDTVKNVVVQMQQGKAVIAAVRGAIQKAPGLPKGLRELIASPYGDLIVGLILHTTAPILTASPVIIKAVKAANVAGAVELSNQFTFVSDAIEGAIASIPGFEEVKEVIKETIADAKPLDEEEGVDGDS